MIYLIFKIIPFEGEEPLRAFTTKESAEDYVNSQSKYAQRFLRIKGIDLYD